MPTELKPQAAKSSNDLPPLTDDARAVLKWLRHRAREASEFAGVDDTAGEAIERLAIMEWGDAARDLFDDSGENMLTDEGDSGDADPLDIDQLNRGLPEAEKWRAEEPGIAMLSLQPRAGDKRPTLITVMGLCASKNPEHRKAGQYAKANPHTMQLPTLADAAVMTQSNSPKLRRLGVALQRNPQFTEDGRPRTAEEQAQDEKLVASCFKR